MACHHFFAVQVAVQARGAGNTSRDRDTSPQRPLDQHISQQTRMQQQQPLRTDVNEHPHPGSSMPQACVGLAMNSAEGSISMGYQQQPHTSAETSIPSAHQQSRSGGFGTQAQAKSEMVWPMYTSLAAPAGFIQPAGNDQDRSCVEARHGSAGRNALHPQQGHSHARDTQLFMKQSGGGVSGGPDRTALFRPPVGLDSA